MEVKEALSLVVTNLRLLANSLELAIGDPPAEYIPSDDELPIPKEQTETKEEETITIEQIRAVLIEKSRAGMRDEVQNLLHAFGVENLSDVPKNKYRELLLAAEEM